MNSPRRTNGRPYARLLSWLFACSCALCALLCVLTLMLLLAGIIQQGWNWLHWDFLRRYPSRFPESTGIRTALAGSLSLIGLTAMIAVPVGVGAAIYLEEYAKTNRWTHAIQINIANLAGVPSIVYGILGLGLFVRTLNLERSLLAGALTLTLVILPIIILSTQEAFRAVPDTIRHASYALGASRWQTVWHQLLPVAIPGIMTGIILSLSRALGEAAPLVAIGAVAYVRFVPTSLFDSFSVLTLQIFNWTDQPQEAFHHVAAAAILVLLAVLISMNSVAIFLRYHFGKYKSSSSKNGR